MKEININLEDKAALAVFTLAAIGATLIALKGMKSFSDQVKKRIKDMEAKANKEEEDSDEEVAATDLFADFDEVTKKREAYLASHAANMEELRAATESFKERMADSKENYQKITVIYHSKNRINKLIDHEAIIVCEDPLGPCIGDISTACGYHPNGYGIFGSYLIEKREEKDTYRATWTTSNTCD